MKNLITFLFCFCLIRCHNDSTVYELAGGDEVGLVCEFETVNLTLNGVKSISVRSTNNVRFFNVYGDGEMLMSFAIRKGDSQPYRMTRFVKIDGETYLINYDDQGEVDERALLD